MEQKVLAEIEDEIIALSKQEANRWAEMAQLLIRVQNEELYSDRQMSFTQWVRDLAERAKVHESLLWRRLKAGRYYLKMKEKKPELPDMENVKISPDNFVLIKDIVGTNVEEGKSLIQKVLDGVMTRKDLKAAKAAVLKQREATGIKRAANGYESRALELNDKNNDKDNVKIGITAAQILLTLQDKRDWLYDSSPLNKAETTSASGTYMRGKYKYIYRVLAEFPVETGDSNHVRRIDAFIVENITSREPRNMTLRGIEIKIARGDLLRDEKMSEYANYCDYFYVAVPSELEADARSVISPKWGILLIHDNDIKVAKIAEKLDAVLKEEALSTALYETL